MYFVNITNPQQNLLLFLNSTSGQMQCITITIPPSPQQAVNNNQTSATSSNLQQGNLSQIQPSNQTTQINPSCTDSDNGLQYYIKGSVSAPNGNPDTCSVTYTSSCQRGGGLYNGMCDVTDCSGSDCYVTEGYCGANARYMPALFKCPNGCQNGACV